MSDLLLWSKDYKFGLSMEETFLLEALKKCSDSNLHETGGILVGYYTHAHDCAIVTELSGPPEDSVRKHGLLIRGTRGLQSWIIRLWNEKKHYYLGEWHFHPGGVPVPSQDDIEQMRKLSMDKKLKCPEPILLIIGGDPRGEWTVNAYIFPADKQHVQLFGSIKYIKM